MLLLAPFGRSAATKATLSIETNGQGIQKYIQR